MLSGWAHLDEYFATARERYRMLLARRAGLPRVSWTGDAVFKEWRFCNVRREDDFTTEWFRRTVRDPLKDNWQVLLSTVAFRWFNRVETAEKLLHLLNNRYAHDDASHPWSSLDARKLLAGVAPVVTGAYIIKTPDGMTKLDGVLWCVDKFRWDHAPSVLHQWDVGELRTLETFHRRLAQAPYLGSFMAYEVVSDLRWTYLLRDAPDVLSWAVAGPGCARGLSWAKYGDPARLDYHSRRDQVELLALMREVLAASRDQALWPSEWPAWEMRESEHWACELWKYANVKYCGGKMKQRYRPRA